MTDFSAGNPGDKGGNEPTSFDTQKDKAPNGSGDSGDSQVVLKVGDRSYTQADLARKITHADTHIKQLTGELAESRRLIEEANEALRRQVNTAELLAKLKGLPADRDNGDEDHSPVDKQPAIPTADEIEERVLSKIEQGRVAKQRQANWESVTQTLTAVFGDKVNAKVQEVAAESGLTLDDAAEMARSKPQVFLRLFPEVSAKGKSPTIGSSGQVNSQAFDAAPRPKSGFLKAASTKDSVAIYLNRLRELGQ